jgi:hypothetical protein
MSAALSAAQRYLAIRLASVSWQSAPWCPGDALLSTRWTNEGLPVTVGEDELECFRSPVFFDASTSHIPLPRATTTGNLASPRSPRYTGLLTKGSMSRTLSVYSP